MTPSPDTGAGTPLTAEEARHRLEYLRNRVGGFRAWEYDALVRDLIATLDAARSRPATDPAGLDANFGSFMADAVRRVSNREAFKFVNVDWSALGSALVAEYVRARLSAADGPGPEERADLEAAVLFGPVGVTFPNLPHHPTGPDVLDAVAAYMDRQDDKAEGEAAGSGFRANRQVQAHLREWANRLRAALPVHREEPSDD